MTSLAQETIQRTVWKLETLQCKVNLFDFMQLIEGFVKLPRHDSEGLDH